MGVTAQDKRIAGLIQKARKPAIVVLNKWDLVKPERREKQAARQLVEETRARLFFLEYAPISTVSAATGENIDSVFASIEIVRHAARQRIGTGVLNRLLRQAFEANPPPLVKGRRLKLLYATQTSGKQVRQSEEPVVRQDRDLQLPDFVLFVNDPSLMNETYRRYLEARIRKAQPFPGLPIILTLRPRVKSETPASRSRDQ
jgi:GTP-binding protein